MPRLHFEGQGNGPVKEWVLSRLLTCIAAAVETCEFGRAENMAVGDDYPMSPPPHHNLQEGRKRPREPSSDSPTESRPRVRPSSPGNSLTAPKASKVP